MGFSFSSNDINSREDWHELRNKLTETIYQVTLKNGFEPELKPIENGSNQMIDFRENCYLLDYTEDGGLELFEAVGVDDPQSRWNGDLKSLGKVQKVVATK